MLWVAKCDKAVVFDTGEEDHRATWKRQKTSGEAARVVVIGELWASQELCILCSSGGAELWR
jgi:hypothetical protein